jgi:anti-sigma regulatory factor (Ser/Thr protein kinase)
MEELRRSSDRFLISEPSQVGEARRYALAAAAELRFSSTQQGRVGIVATELASNLAKHSHGGELIVQEIKAGEARGLELLALDSGPGFSDLGKVMSDGYSTAGSPGTGLGAVRRLSQTFDVFSGADFGSVFAARVWAQENGHAIRRFEYGVVSVPRPGENANGDFWWVDEPDAGRQMLMVADGLGHGEFAARAAEAAVQAFRTSREKEPEAIIASAHGALRSTRGAAMAVALIDAGQQRVEYAGIGNIVAGIVSASGIRRMVSYDGTVGHAVRKIQKFTYPWPADALLIMHSDGLSANWNLERYPGLLVRHPSVIAAVLYRDHRRKNDDATVLVVREQGLAKSK